ncbi:ribonuclease III domain-containing protein [Ruminococcus sp.]|uniref:Mini-ribonuclease 3 n=1 Tax=Ruminococcus sp. TaxID=41978 RepID=UPI0025D82FBF|nr:ribonuclease III domain-containing protein [Ruminococcus sp.]
MQYSPLALAFIGDGVYEMRVREKLILGANMPADKLHKLTVKRVCAEYQAQAVHKWIEDGLLDEQETELFKRGRNAKGINAPRHSTVGEYRAATGLECLFGFLYLTGREDRITELFESAWAIGEDNKDNKDN